jgi:hypothetical protein
MIRLTNNDARAVFTALLVLKTRLPEHLHNSAQQAYGRGDITRDEWTSLASPEEGTVPQLDLATLWSSVQKQLKSERNGMREVLDWILNIVKDPLGLNRISTDVLQAIRKQVLSPDEIEEFDQKLTKQLICSSCKHEFDDAGELAVVINDGCNVSLRCSNCGPPILCACSTQNCKESVRFKFSSPKIKCETCGGAKVNETEGMKKVKVAARLYADMGLDNNPFGGFDDEA